MVTIMLNDLCDTADQNITRHILGTSMLKAAAIPQQRRVGQQTVIVAHRRRGGWLQMTISTNAMMTATRKPIMSIPPFPSSSSAAPQQIFPMGEERERERGEKKQVCGLEKTKRQSRPSPLTTVGGCVFRVMKTWAAPTWKLTESRSKINEG